MATKNASWMSHTEQQWKVWLFLFMIAVSLSLFVLFVWRVNVPSPDVPALPDQVTLSFCFIITGVVALTWLWLSVRCPACKAKVAAHILKTNPAGVWLTCLLTLEKCPHCGNRAGDQL